MVGLKLWLWLFEILIFLTGFQMVFDKMTAICPDFRSHTKSRLVGISDPLCLNIILYINRRLSSTGLLTEGPTKV